MTINISLDNIIIPDSYKEAHLKPGKLENRIRYYTEHGSFKSNIVITQKKVLTDGYYSYLVARSLGIKTVTCAINTDKLRMYQGSINKHINNKPRKRRLLYDMQDGKCIMCNKQLQIDDNTDLSTYLTLDHIMPVCRGGSGRLSNLQGLCYRCNRQKSDSLDFVFMYDSQKGSGTYEEIFC